MYSNISTLKKVTKNFKLLSTIVLVVILQSVFVSASPNIQILSPQNIQYNTTKVIINVTSNETVNFYVKAILRDFLVKSNDTSYESAFYGKAGIYKLTIYANNSNGTATKTVEFNITAPNPVEITEGGYLGSSNTEYILVNNITDFLYWSFPTENISVNLNGFAVNSPFAMGTECSHSKIANGTLNGRLIIPYSTGCLFKKLTINSEEEAGVLVWDTENTVLEDITVKASFGIYSAEHTAKLIIKNSTFISSGPPREIYGIEYDVAFLHDMSQNDEFTLENVKVVNFTRDVNWLYASIPTYILRSTKLNISESDLYFSGMAKIYTQHLAVINTTDQNGEGVPVVVEIEDNSTVSGDPMFDINVNPTHSLLIATNESGLAETWLTEKISILRIESPLSEEVISYSPYTLIARTRDTTTTQTLNIVGNSTFNVNMSLEFPTTQLPDCTIFQMLDFNNDGDINAKDIKIVVDYMVGKPVEVIPENCRALNLFLP
jgi:hypothetical protein